jgi:small subunit ribosomal protein S6
VNEYELMTILHPRLNADEVKQTVETIEGRLTGAGGELISTDVWGRRRLAYPIQHLAEGTYVLFTFRLAPTETRGIESWLRISESVLRHLLVRGIIPYEGPERSEPPAERAAASPAATEEPAEAADAPAEAPEDAARDEADPESAPADEAPAESEEERREPAVTGETQATSE